jgi:hypothetical protein
VVEFPSPGWSLSPSTSLSVRVWTQEGQRKNSAARSPCLCNNPVPASYIRASSFFLFCLPARRVTQPVASFLLLQYNSHCCPPYLSTEGFVIQPASSDRLALSRLISLASPPCTALVPAETFLTAEPLNNSSAHLATHPPPWTQWPSNKTASMARYSYMTCNVCS